MHKIVIARPMPRAVEAHARAAFDAWVADHVLSADEAVAAITAHGARALVLGTNLRLDRAAVTALPDSVRIVATTSVGFDHLDVAALKERGIAAAYVPQAVTACTADLAFMLLLCAARRAHEYEVLARAGWRRKLGFDELLGIRVSGKALGIVGMGRIGRAMARRASGFDMPVHYHDLQPVDDPALAGAVFHADLDKMLPHCQFLSLHAPGGAQPLMDERRLALLPPGAVLVNAARGSLVDEDALIAALQSGRLAAAGLDTFRNEPVIDLRLTALPNVFMTPHMGTATVETRDEMGLRALDNVAAVLDGGAPLDPLWT
ncbi:D-glycerate dehydrogenase [Xylophilus sp. GOD-11R]|uniref:2-hydroxyacid dehydrogenase n=1 Tax=Xylophilus sp. GOD-11R TaxID=3089814 RepID=UPI00298C39F2|nr:D-glycerate dehydrogenase [Xylophilus sp. GOD-11R]WPB57473.1 D-glycerate dehydrogenase [Xylophilus sp. GOD-11R]